MGIDLQQLKRELEKKKTRMTELKSSLSALDEQKQEFKDEVSKKFGVKVSELETTLQAKKDSVAPKLEAIKKQLNGSASLLDL